MFYSPILFSKIADVNLTNYCEDIINIDYLNTKDKIIIYCFNSMEYLNKLHQFFIEIKKPFVIITAMEDNEFPSQFDKNLIENLKKNQYFKHWFAINKTIPDDDLFTSIPYGLNYWTLSTQNYFGESITSFEDQNAQLEKFNKNSISFIKRKLLIYANFHLNYTDGRYGNWRRQLMNILPKELVVYQETLIPRSETYKNMLEYSFVLSPFGNGLDCIRTFEALCLGCIVIIKKSCLDIIYEDLPVYSVDMWEDINETLLNNIIIDYSQKIFNYEKLKMDYWVKLVNSKF